MQKGIHPTDTPGDLVFVLYRRGSRPFARPILSASLFLGQWSKQVTTIRVALGRTENEEHGPQDPEENETDPKKYVPMFLLSPNDWHGSIHFLLPAL